MSDKEISNLLQIVDLFSRLEERNQELVCAYASGLLVGQTVEKMDLGEDIKN